MRQSESVKNLYTALLKFQDEVGPIYKDAVNPHFKSNFPTLKSCIEGTHPALNRNGLLVHYPTSFIDGITILHTRLVHAPSGEFIESDWPLLPTRNDPQGLGAANTYARRYSLLSMLHLVAEDDDGNMASQRSTETLAVKIQAPMPKAASTSGNPGDFVITFGKHADKKIKELPPRDIESYGNWLVANAKNTGKPLSQNAKDFITNAEAYLSKDASEVPPFNDEDIPF